MIGFKDSNCLPSIMIKYCLLLSALFFFYYKGNAQQIMGYVKDIHAQPVSGASISLQHKAITSKVNRTITNGSGFYQFLNIDSGEYIVKVSFSGFEDVLSPSVIVNNQPVQVVDLIIVNKILQLDSLAVQAYLPAIDLTGNKTVLHIDRSINTIGSDVLTILQNAPEVTIDNEGSISIAGKSGVQVYVDGKPVPLAGTDLKDYLHSLQSTQIEIIEIMKNPPVQFEAEGNAGIINIKLKKFKQWGTNGSISADYGIATYPKYNAGVTLNNRSAYTNLFASLHLADNKTLGIADMNRIISDSGFLQKTSLITNHSNYRYKVGADFFINRFHTLGVKVDGSNADLELISKNNTDISYLLPSSHIVRLLKAINTNKSSRSNINSNINYQFIDSTGNELNVDIDYGKYKNKGNQVQPNVFFDPTGLIELSHTEYQIEAPTEIDIYSLKLGLERNLKGGRIAFGVKWANVKTKNDFRRFDVLDSDFKLDSLRSNLFQYKEKIHAAYVNYSRSISNFIIQTGIRLEETQYTGRSVGFEWNGNMMAPYDSMYRGTYLDIFPSISLTYKITPLNLFDISYSRRIDRPNYQDLNPIEYKLDEYTYVKGNPKLQPQYTNTISLKHSYKYKLVTTLSYSRVRNFFSMLVDTTEKSKAFLSKRNLASQNIINLSFSYPISIKDYEAFLSLNSFYSRYKANFGEGRGINLETFSVTIQSQQTYKFSPTITGEISAWYVAPAISQGTFKSKGYGAVNIGVQKSMFNSRGKLKLLVNDVFYTMRWAGTSSFAGQTSIGYGKVESRLFKMSFTYRFGKGLIKQIKQNKDESDEEMKRAESQEGSQIGG